jgi:hypothetical protein
MADRKNRTGPLSNLSYYPPDFMIDSQKYGYPSNSDCNSNSIH